MRYHSQMRVGEGYAHWRKPCEGEGDGMKYEYVSPCGREHNYIAAQDT